MISDKSLINNIYNKFYVDKIFNRESYKTNAENEVRFITSILPLPQPCFVLDVGCGMGFHSNAFACRGHQTVGIDLSSACIETAKKNFLSPNLEFIEIDVQKFVENEIKKFDLVVNLGMGFGYSLLQKQNDEDLKRISIPIKAGGYLVIQNLNKHCCLHKFRTSNSFWRETNEFYILDRREFLENDLAMMSTKIFIDKQTNEIHRFQDIVMFYEIETLNRLFESVGLDFQCGYNSFDGKQINMESSFLPILIYKKK